MSNDQAPECCPFCGAIAKDGWDRVYLRWFTCGTMTRADNNRRDQTPACAAAERERLTRELDEARGRVKRLQEAVESLLPYAEATDDESSEWGPGRWKSEKLKRIIDEARKAKEATR